MLFFVCVLVVVLVFTCFPCFSPLFECVVVVTTSRVWLRRLIGCSIRQTALFPCSGEDFKENSNAFWRVSRSISVWAIFDDTSGEILTLLAKMQATNWSGPYTIRTEIITGRIFCFGQLIKIM